MVKLDFDDDFSRLMEEFNVSPGAVERRARISAALGLTPGMRVLDVGSGPAHQAFDLAPVVGPGGHVHGIDSGEGSVEIARRRCADLDNVTFTLGDANALPFDDSSFDVAMSSQVFEYLDDVETPLAEMHRILKPGGRVLVHGTAWGALLWHSRDLDRMAQILRVWDGHLADPRMAETMTCNLVATGFANIRAEPIVHVETMYDSSSMSAILTKFIVGYVVTQGVSQDEADAWAAELMTLDDDNAYFFSSNEYMFFGEKPSENEAGL